MKPTHRKVLSFLSLSGLPMHVLFATTARSPVGEPATRGRLTHPKDSSLSVVVGLGHSCALRSDGSVVCWGSNREGQLVAPEESFTEITAAKNYSCGFRSDGSISCWGNQQTNINRNVLYSYRNTQARSNRYVHQYRSR